MCVMCLEHANQQSEAGPSRAATKSRSGFPALHYDDDEEFVARVNTSILSPDSVPSTVSRSRQPSRLRSVASPSLPPSPSPNPIHFPPSLPPLSPSPQPRHYQLLFSSQESYGSGGWSSSPSSSSSSSTPRPTPSRKGKERAEVFGEEGADTGGQTPTTLPPPPSRTEQDDNVHPAVQTTTDGVSNSPQLTPRARQRDLPPDVREPSQPPRSGVQIVASPRQTPPDPDSLPPASPPRRSPVVLPHAAEEHRNSPPTEDPSPIYRSLCLPKPLDSQDPLDFFDNPTPAVLEVANEPDPATQNESPAFSPPPHEPIQIDVEESFPGVERREDASSCDPQEPRPLAPTGPSLSLQDEHNDLSADLPLPDADAASQLRDATPLAMDPVEAPPRKETVLFPPSLISAPSQPPAAAPSERARPSSPPGASQRSSLLRADLRIPASQRSHRSRQSDGPADPALLQFRFARTFRNRTALQLQPYTRERQMYERALKRGGLAKSKRAIAPLREVKEASDIDEEEEGASDRSSDEDVTPPDAIVIGATQEREQQQKQRKPQPPVELVDADFDEYLLDFGEAPAEDDEDAQRELQKIARKRLRAEKEARRAARRAERERREFEALLGERRGEDLANRQTTSRQRRDTPKAQDQPKRPAVQSAARKQREKTPQAQKSKGAQTKGKTGKTPRTMTYSRRHREARDRAGSDIDSDLSDPPEEEAPSAPPVRVLSPDSDAAPPQSQGPPHREASALPTPLSPDVFGGMDYDMDTGAAFFDDINTPSPGSINREGDDDEAQFRGRSSRSTSAVKRKRLPSSSSADSDDPSSPVPAPRDKRQKIARRMLPGVMLKRLEQDARERERRRLEEKRRARSRTKSPVRPGHAVLRRGGGGALDDMADLFNDSDEEDSLPQVVDLAAEEGSDGSDRDGPIDVSSDSSSDGFEAMEDNRPNDALARLQRGDFESIVRGRTAEPPRRKDSVARLRPKKQRRPMLGFTKQRRSVLSSTGRLVQTRLDFPVEEPGAARKNTKSRRASRPEGQRSAGRSAGRKTSTTTRPAIRLDDHVIFATDEFAFDSDSEVEIVAEKSPTPRTADPIGRTNRPFQRVQSKGARRPIQTTLTPPPAPAPAPPRVTKEQVDEGVGRARSWANFEKFPIDFDIQPLPTGVFLSCDTVPGSGRLNALIDVISGQAEELKPLRASGVHLHSEMSTDEVAAVLPIVLDAIYDQVVRFADNVESAPPDFAPLVFFRDYLAQKSEDTKTTIYTFFPTFAERLNTVSVTGRKEDRPLMQQLLLARYALLELAVISSSPDVVTVASTVISLLLTHGFDRTVKPLKRLLRGDSDTPEIRDPTVGVWVALGHALAAFDALHEKEDTFGAAIGDALEQRYKNELGPLAAERVWFLVFGLCAISQFNHDGSVEKDYVPTPRWSLVKRALGLIKVTHSLEVEEAAHRDQLLGRDRYIKTMVARCLRLSSTWQWSFDRSSFSVATRDLGMIFKERQQRNLPTEPAADFPTFISSFDFSLTATEDTKHASAFELYLRLAAVAASDLIASAEELTEAHQAERDVQRLIMSIFPLSAVPFSRERPPTPRQLGALINRYSTMVVACYFSPALLPWLLANSVKWLSFEAADFESRQVCIRGLMYLAVACRHHGHALDGVVGKLAEILAILQAELEKVKKPTYIQQGFFPRRIEIERTMVLVVTCFRQIIQHASYTPREEPVYPDPALLHESWTGRVFELDLAKDVKSGLEIVSTIQAFLDARAAALPKKANKARDLKRAESDDYPSLGFEFDDIDLELLGGADLGDAGQREEDPTEKMDAQFARIIMDVICPKINRLLSDMLPTDAGDETERERERERLVLVGKLTKCWSDCAGIVVVEHGIAVSA